MCLACSTINAQHSSQAPVPVKAEETNFECDIVLDIYDAFFDWITLTPFGGNGQPLSAGPKFSKGAICLANLNDTNGNGIVDKDETDISANSLGRNEIDLMKLVIRPRDVSISLSGNIELTKLSGGPAIKLWRTPNKVLSTDEVTLPATISSSELPITLYVEALEPSQTVRDIVLTASYGNKQDIVRATAYWVDLVNTYGETTDDPDLVGLGVNECIKFQINNNVQGSSSKYGFGKFRNNTKLGGRILFEWQVLPSDHLAYNLISIDGTRQRSTRNWSVDMNLPTGPDCNFVLKEVKFPFDDNMDNELPNDDAYHPSKSDACYTAITTLGKFFTWDAPSVVLSEEFEQGGAFPLYRAFVDDKTNFLEYIRIAPNGYDFNPLFIGAGKLLGSRASDKIEWANAYYTRKNSNFLLSVDDSEYGFNHVRINLQEDHNNYPISYTNISLSQSYLGSYTTLIFDILEDDYELSLFRLSADQNGNCTVQDENHEITLPKQANLTFTYDNHTLNLQLLEPLSGIVTAYNWHTFQSANKANELRKDSHHTNLNH